MAEANKPARLATYSSDLKSKTPFVYQFLGEANTFRAVLTRRVPARVFRDAPIPPLDSEDERSIVQ